MFLSSRKERSKLIHHLKEFAFEQSPMFRDDQIQAMGVDQEYEFIEKIAEEFILPGTLAFDQTKIVLGFHAIRFCADSGRPAYTFEAFSTGTTLIHPQQLVLDDDEWHSLMHDYLDEAPEEESLQEGDVLEDVEVLSDEEIREEIVSAIIEEGHECELYQKASYTFSTEEPAIESTYEHGISIHNAMFAYRSTTYHQALDSNWEEVPTAEGFVHFVPPRLYPDELPLADEIDIRMRFSVIVGEAGLVNDVNLNALIPEQDKVEEMMYLVDCMRKRRIKTLRDLKDD